MDRHAWLFVLILTVPFQGCHCAATRQAVYPESRSSIVEDYPGEVRVQAPFVDVRVPGKSTPASTPIDVPMLNH